VYGTFVLPTSSGARVRQANHALGKGHYCQWSHCTKFGWRFPKL